MGSGNNYLKGVTATSACDAWAVGYYYNGKAERTLIEHWNGKSWKVVKSPNRGGPASHNELYGVAATSSTSAWAVGSYDGTSARRTLILHWNGKSWKAVPSPNLGGFINDDALRGVAASSSRDAWAVGNYYNGTAFQTLILHWNGKAWKTRQSANPGAVADGFNAVTATSSRDAWAVGSYRNSEITQVDRTLIEHWNGKAWTVEQSPSPANGQNYLTGVSSVSGRNAWAVGYYLRPTASAAYQTLILHWNGKSWKRRDSPNRGASHNELYGVAATSSRNAWAVGTYWNGAAYRTLIEHWNGAAWKAQKSPNDSSSASFNLLYGVAATPFAGPWAVGNYSNAASTNRTLIEHWTGTAWKG